MNRRIPYLQVGMALVCCWILAAGMPFAAVKLPHVFGDHMVLQRGMDAPLWGWADPGERVTVQGSWQEQGTTVAAGEDGRFRTILPVPEEKGPYTITVKGENRIVLRDVLAGEVWLASGQSNMEMCLDKIHAGYHGVLNYKEEIASARYPEIRLFTVPNRLSVREEADCEGTWQVCTPETVAKFSAAAYFFGRELHRELGVPVGLVDADWGGTPAEAWTSAEGLVPLRDFDDALAELERRRNDPEAAARAYAQRLAAWRKKFDEADPGTPGRWMDPSFHDADWKTMELPALWEEAGLPGFDGTVWFRKAVDLPEDLQGRDLLLQLGPIDDMDTTWFNGRRVGEVMKPGYWQTPRTYVVPASLVKPGRNVITVRVLDTSGAGGFGGKRGAMFLGAKEGGGTRISLAGAWRYRPGAKRSALPGMPAQNPVNSHTPTVLYNGMIAPIEPFAIRGVIWYQGESNRLRWKQYRTLFPAMIRDWRRVWGEGDFPFYFVQIAPFRYGGDPEAAARLREAQAMALALENTGMAVTVDIGNPTNIHPKNKQEVGRRLALWALACTYGKKDLVYSGPLYRSMQKEGKRIRIFFDHVDGGLEPEDEPLAGFKAAGADRVFHPAEARVDGDSVVVFSEAVADPVAVRFAFEDAPDTNLRNKAGLPAAPFRTDDW